MFVTVQMSVENLNIEIKQEIGTTMVANKKHMSVKYVEKCFQHLTIKNIARLNVQKKVTN
jgi:hypothetical protein